MEKKEDLKKIKETMKKNWDEIEADAIRQAKKEEYTFEDFEKTDTFFAKEMERIDDEHADKLNEELEKILEEEKKENELHKKKKN